MGHLPRLAAVLLAGSAIVAAGSAQSQAKKFTATVLPPGVQRGLADVEELVLPPIDLTAVALEDDVRRIQGDAPRYAIPHRVEVTPLTDGTWDQVDAETWRWRLRVSAQGAYSINLGFTDYYLPERAELVIHDAFDPTQRLRPFTEADNEEHGELWTPVVLSDQVVVQLTIPAPLVSQMRLQLGQIGYGYRGFGAPPQASRSGSCNVDVICPEGDGWRNEIPSVGVISTGGSTFCTGFLVNNTANDGTPYFMTAYHCGISSGNASSLVVYWNYENSWCRPPDGSASGQPGDGSLSEFNTGSIFRAGYSTSDVTLVELDDDPSPFNVTYSGWDRSGVDATEAIAIHHPNTDEKRISFEYDPTSVTSYLGTSVPGDGTHVRVTDWDLGTTEPGSSGSPLYDQNHRVIGQLHGGYAACGNDSADWYGAFSVSWTGGGTPSTRLSDWLDPGATGATTVDTLGGGMSVTPGGVFLHAGPVGGPFTDPTTVYTLSNNTTTPISYQVSLTNFIGILIDGDVLPVSGTLPVGGSAQVLVTLGPDVYNLGIGEYQEVVQFADLTNGISPSRTHTVEVGRGVVASFPFDSDPGWDTEGQWAFGTPTGGGGQYGGPDPTGGHTGTNVYGYNLGGDYTNNMPAYDLTSTAIDCTGITGVELRFWRWLNVEQPAYDHARLSVSTDGTSFTQIWENGGTITDSAWTQQSFDISSIADGQPTVYLRWTMGTTDGSWLYSGWNIDDVELWGFTTSALATSRNSGTNPASYTATTLPVLGGTYTGTVDLGGTTGHAAALLLGYSSPLNLLLPSGQTVLVNVSDPQGELLHKRAKLGPTAVFHVAVPNDASLLGLRVYTQAVHVGGVTPWLLSNAQDLLLGY